MVTSRFIPTIMQYFKEGLRLEIRASDEDVRMYLEGQKSHLPKCVQENKELQDFMKTNIIAAANGMCVPILYTSGSAHL